MYIIVASNSPGKGEGNAWLHRGAHTLLDINGECDTIICNTEVVLPGAEIPLSQAASPHPFLDVPS